MSIRFVTKTMHAYLDYPVAAGLILFPVLLGLGQSHPAALWASVATGIAALILTLLTDHQLGVIRIIPFRLHKLVDICVGLIFLALPIVLGFRGLDTAFYWICGAAVIVVIALSVPQTPEVEAA